MPVTGYAVVTLMTTPCEADLDTRCVMSVLLEDGLRPFTRERATEVAAQQPEWSTPHTILVFTPDS